MTIEFLLDNFWITLLGSLGGVTGIITIIVKYYATITAENLSKEYDTKLKKELELFKHNLDTHKYITQAQYNLELEIYRQLSGNLYAVIVKLSITITNNLKKDIPKESILEFEKNHFTETLSVVEKFQNSLHENAAFIPENIFIKYDNIYMIVNKLFWKYKEQLKKYINGDIKSDEFFSYEDILLLKELQTKHKTLNKELRDYLQKLKIIK